MIEVKDGREQSCAIKDKRIAERWAIATDFVQRLQKERVWSVTDSTE